LTRVDGRRNGYSLGHHHAGAKPLDVEGGYEMGASDKVGNKVDEAAGKAKEATGKATDNERLENEGRADQAKSDIKQAAEKVKDAFKR
jgi:uncharacterized protein YjbJ (UPF0337 family)